MCACVTTILDTSRTLYPAASRPASTAPRPPSGRSGRHTPQSTRVTRSPSASTCMFTLSTALTPTGNGTRVSPSPRTPPSDGIGLPVHAFQQREPDAHLHAVGGAGAVHRAGDVLHLEPGDALEGQPRPVQGLAHRVLDRLARPGEVHRLLHRHRVMMARPAAMPCRSRPAEAPPSRAGQPAPGQEPAAERDRGHLQPRDPLGEPRPRPREPPEGG